MLRKISFFLCACVAPLWAGGFVITQQGEIVTAPRSSVAKPLLFTLVTNQNGFDTEVTISNTSQDTLGSTPQAGTCTAYYYGADFIGQTTSPSIPAGKQWVFTLSQVLSIPGGFSGYVIANCGFPLARGIAKVFAADGVLAFSNDAQVLTTPRSTATPEFLLFPFITNQAGFDTGMVIANSSLDPFGTTQASGSCTFNFYGTNAPAPQTTGTISAGTTYGALASLIAPNFQGYAIASCNFNSAAAIAFVSDLGAHTLALAETAELLTTPRSTTPRPLLFSSVTNQNGLDTGISIANTSADPFGTTSGSGFCTLNFFGSNAPAPVTTPTIAAGGMYVTLTSVIAPNFQGYVIPSCSFPLARGWAFTTPLGANADGDSQTPEIVTVPRSTSPVALLFSDATNWNGSDTSITISNTTEDPFGTSQTPATCAISYFGAVGGGGGSPSPQTSGMIQPGAQLSFSLSQGNPAQGIEATPGFHGYVIASCGFPLARGVATIHAAQTPTAALRDAEGSIRLSNYASSTLVSAGGAFASDPSAAQDLSGNTFAVARDSSNAVWTNVFDASSQTWGIWAPAGGAITGVPAVAVAPGGTAWIASRDSFSSYWLLSYTPGIGYGAWIHLAGSFATDPVVAACGDGSVYVVGRDNFTALWSGRYIPGTGFQGFVLGGGAVQGKSSVSCGSDNVIYIVSRDSFNSNWIARVSGNTWTGWFNGGAATNIDPRIAALGANLAIVILDANGAVWRATFTEGTGNGWQAWTGVGGSLQDISPAAAGGVLYFVGRAPNGDLWWWLQTGSQWTWIANNGVAAGALSAAPR